LQPEAHKEIQPAVQERIDALDSRLAGIESDLARIRLLLGEPLPIDPQFVAESLGLTPAQSRVAVALAEGETVHDIAEAMGAKSTVRWHLRQINRKLKISTQAQLVRLVLLLPHATTARLAPDARRAGREAGARALSSAR